MEKLNCWEYKKCRREPGGAKARELGVCPAAIAIKADGINSGKNGGRCCWVFTGTLCGGEIQGSFAQKISNCMKCEFYKLVVRQEGDKFESSRSVIKKLK
jgi:hypothetical protein